MAQTCAMETVLDTNLRVKGFQTIRVVDLSMFPVPLEGYPQASSYAIANFLAEFVAEWKYFRAQVSISTGLRNLKS
ncbi:hypothetical protein BOTCAL_0595g00040 [Botryotinia calthae]|uniref:Glucose-methanol-choline oxidoreductase C-terminal domain-containing protein n=1 Tax=Botryotinia calthae TaxID=38488 RepID=A0A4Y8CJL6_9HELO|nr:hypothetical protein BOTCAL_0595g00040 [Botryotinia calthae]